VILPVHRDYSGDFSHRVGAGQAKRTDQSTRYHQQTTDQPRFRLEPAATPNPVRVPAPRNARQWVLDRTTKIQGLQADHHKRERRTRSPSYLQLLGWAGLGRTSSHVSTTTTTTAKSSTSHFQPPIPGTLNQRLDFSMDSISFIYAQVSFSDAWGTVRSITRSSHCSPDPGQPPVRPSSTCLDMS
jgi:hypothetical protein